MSVIGQQIKKYRMEKDITQEQLGELVGVTTQAVSRWERGGTPDAEILPALSDILGVSIDALYGREEQNLLIQLAKHISQLSEKDGYRYALNTCWAMMNGFLKDAGAIDDFLNRFIDRSFYANSKNKSYFAKIIQNCGISTMRMSADFQYSFLMSDPEHKLRDQLESIEDIRKVFEIFSDEKILRIIFFILSMPLMPLAASLICKKTGLSEQDVGRCMDILCKLRLTEIHVVATADGNMNSYMMCPESFAVPLICFADEIAKDDNYPVFGTRARNEPYL